MTREQPLLPVAWSDLQLALRVDGSLRDVIAGPGDLESWQAAYEYTQRLVAEGRARAVTEPRTLPQTVAEIFELRRTGDAWMHLYVGPLQINCHFFGEPIEFDIEPREVSSPEAGKLLLDFIEGLASAVGRPASITEENLPESVWLSYDPASGAWRRGPMFWRSER